MFDLLCRPLAVAALGAIGLSVSWASARPDPLDPGAAVPPAAHRSAFAGYRPVLADVPVEAWRVSNDRVARVGGWRAYAREAATPAAAAASTPATAADRH